MAVVFTMIIRVAQQLPTLITLRPPRLEGGQSAITIDMSTQRTWIQKRRKGHESKLNELPVSIDCTNTCTL